MSRSLISRISLRGRVAVVVSACALCVAGAMALVGSANSSAAQSGSTLTRCSDASLNGTYTNSGISWSTGSSPAATAYADFSQFDGHGGSTGTATVVSGGTVVFGPFASDTGSYTINPDCTGTLEVKIGTSTAEFDLYVSPSGSLYTEVQTSPASEFAVTSTRVSP